MWYVPISCVGLWQGFLGVADYTEPFCRICSYGGWASAQHALDAYEHPSYVEQHSLRSIAQQFLPYLLPRICTSAALLPPTQPFQHLTSAVLDTINHCCTHLLKGPLADVQVVHVTTAPALVAVVVAGVVAAAAGERTIRSAKGNGFRGNATNFCTCSTSGFMQTAAYSPSRVQRSAAVLLCCTHCSAKCLQLYASELAAAAYVNG